MREYVIALALAGCGLSTSTDTEALTTSDTWPQFGYNGSHTQYTSNGGTITADNVATMHVAWTAMTGAAPGDPSVAGGRVYIGSANNTLYAFDANTGRRVWRAFATRDVKSTPAAAFGIVAFTANDGVLYVVDAHTGARLWTADINDPRYPNGFDSSHGSPQIANGVIYVAGLSKLYTFDVHGCGATTCGPLWTADIPTRVSGATSPVTLGGHKVYVLGSRWSNEDMVFAFSADGCGAPTCAPLWDFTQSGSRTAEVVAANSRVYVQNEYQILSIRPDTGLRFADDWWKYVGDPDGWPAYANGRWFLTNYLGGLQVFDATQLTQQPIWRTAATYARAPIVVNDVVFVLLGNPQVLTAFSVNCGTGGEVCAPLWTDTVPVGSLDPFGTGTAARPVVAGGMVFIGDRQTNTLRALAL